MVRIQFTKFGANSAFGGFAPGETMRCGEEMARHLVEEVGCAKYVEQPKVEESQAAPAEKKTRKAKQSTQAE